MGRLLFSAGGYSCSWMVTNDPGVTPPPHRGRVSGTQGQRWWVLLLLGTAGPPTPAYHDKPHPFCPNRNSVLISINNPSRMRLKRSLLFLRALNIFEWNSNQNTTIFTQENAFENVVCKMAILSRSQCDNYSGALHRIEWHSFCFTLKLTQ